MKKFITICAAVIFVMTMSAGAATINYTVSGWGPNQYPASTTPPAGAPWGVNGYPGDTLEMVTYTGTLDLTPGTYNLKINTLKWTIDYTYGGTETQWDYPDHWSDLSFNINVARGMSIGTAAGSLSQAGLLEITWFNDYSSFGSGSTTSFTVQGYRVNVTPLGLSRVAGSNFSGSNPWVQPEQDVIARFDVVPEPCPEPLVGDLDGDCRVNFIDFAMMAENWLKCNLVTQQADVTLGWTNSGMASWTTTTSMVGPSSVELYWPNTTSNGYADINTPAMTLGQVNTWSCWVKGINSSGGQVMVADVSFYLGDAKNTVVHSEFLWGCNPPIDTWTQVTQASISVGSGIYSVRGIGVSENLSSWASVISKYGSYNLSYVRLGMGNKGYTGSFTSYVDDFVMNGTTYVVEPATITCSEPLVGDMDGDCRVNFIDFAKMAENWLKCNLQPQSSCP